MPPKKKKGGGGGGGGAKKVTAAQREKIVADKTFGLKNKKRSTKVQKYVAQVRKDVESKTQTKKPKRTDAAERARREQQDRAALLAGQQVVQKKAKAGEDSKSILCAYFKAGNCRRGNKCKFSHDLAVERKAVKIDLYTDRRDAGDEETMDDWDQDTLESVIEKKHGALNRQTDIVCKYFIQAIEERKYGWFWQCPNGDACMYRHALPPGYVFESEKKKKVDVDSTPIEELVEEQRANLEVHTPLTLELFLQWKAKKKAAQAAAAEAAQTKRRADISSGKVQMSGRELFAHNESLFVDDECAVDSSELQMEESVRGLEINVTGTSISRRFADSDLIAAHVQKTGAKSDTVKVVHGVAVDSSLFVSLEGVPELDYEN